MKKPEVTGRESKQIQTYVQIFQTMNDKWIIFFVSQKNRSRVMSFLYILYHIFVAKFNQTLTIETEEAVKKMCMQLFFKRSYWSFRKALINYIFCWICTSSCCQLAVICRWYSMYHGLFVWDVQNDYIGIVNLRLTSMFQFCHSLQCLTDDSSCTLLI